MKNNYFESGQWNTICDRCGFKFKSGELKKTWDNLWVCPEDWETRHIADFIKAPAPDKPIDFARPEQELTFVGPTYIDESVGTQETDLPPATNHGELD